MLAESLRPPPGDNVTNVEVTMRKNRRSISCFCTSLLSQPEFSWFVWDGIRRSGSGIRNWKLLEIITERTAGRRNKVGMSLNSTCRLWGGGGWGGRGVEEVSSLYSKHNNAEKRPERTWLQRKFLIEVIKRLEICWFKLCVKRGPLQYSLFSIYIGF